MDERMKKRAAFYTLTAILDAGAGEIMTRHHEVKRIHNNENDVVMAERTDGSHCLAYDLSFDVLDSIVREWREAHIKEFNRIFS